MNNIIFSPSSIADLYKNHLVINDDHIISGSVASIAPQQLMVPEVASKKETAYKYIGSNKKRISILITAADTYAIPEDYLTFLANILKACKFSLEDVAILNHSSQRVEIQKLKDELAPSIVILFGINPVETALPINFPQFKLQPYDSVTYLYAPDLNQIKADTEDGKLLKSKLWLCLRQLFQI